MAATPIPRRWQAPELTCPEPTTTEQETADGTALTLEATAVDDIDPAPVVESDAPAVFPLGNTVVSFTATDASGNSSQCTTTVTVEDTTAPSITCPAGVTAEQTSLDGATVSLGVATASDVCDASPEITNDAPTHVTPSVSY